MAMHPLAPVGEPARTIHCDSWRAARTRAVQLTESERVLFSSLLDALEMAWPHVRTLQLLHDELGPDATGTLAHVLDFIDTHVCDLFLNLASGVEAFIPEPSGAVVRMPDFDATNADAEQFGSFVVVLGATTYDPALPQPAASVIRSATEALSGWYEPVRPVLVQVADAVQGP
jgi:hypothetical protein